jgi:hypothetical protein
MAKEINDQASSVRERLRNYSNEHGEEFQSVLVRYGAERFLYRLSESEHRETPGITARGRMFWLSTEGHLRCDPEAI